MVIRVGEIGPVAYSLLAEFLWTGASSIETLQVFGLRDLTLLL